MTVPTGAVMNELTNNLLLDKFDPLFGNVGLVIGVKIYIDKFMPNKRIIFIDDKGNPLKAIKI